MPSNPIRLAVVNDYEVVVVGIAAMMQRYTDRIEIVELNANTPLSQPVDIALYDTFAQPQGDQADLTALIEGRLAQRTVVYTWNLEPTTAAQAMAHGASGYLSKALSASALVEALEAIHGGELIISSRPNRSSATTLPGEWPGREEGLTQRESEVLALITQGMSNDQIAKRVFLSINSVKSYIRSCYRKIGVTSRAQAVLWGVQHGFLPDSARRDANDSARSDANG